MQGTDVGEQNALFPDLDNATVYEQPLNERIRNCLRLEHLFEAIKEGVVGESEWHSRAAISGMLEVSDLLTRADIKGELIKELERHVTKINSLRDKPGVDPALLEETLATTAPVIARLKSNDCQPGARIRADELITQIKQRIAIPGGTCNFDLPAYHHWLSKPARERIAEIQYWADDLTVVDEAVCQVLRLLRDSTAPKLMSVEDGLFQQSLDPGLQVQLVRLFLSSSLDVFPEISGGKHRFAVRFFRQPETSDRPIQARELIAFEIQCCALG